MKKIIWTKAAVLALAFLQAGCGEKIPQGKFSVEQMESIPAAQRDNLPAPTGGMTLNVGSETITIEEILGLLPEQLKQFAAQNNYNLFRDAALPAVRQALSSRVTDILLYQEAKKKAPDNIDQALDGAVEKEVNRFISAYGNNYALVENALKEQGMDWKRFRDYQRRVILTQSYLSTEFTEKRPVSRRQMLEYYNSVRQKQFSSPGMIQFSLIELDPAKLPAELIGPDEAAETAAVRISIELIERVRGGEDFAALAEKYSTGPLASVGGLWQPITIGSDSLAEPYDVLEKYALLLETGQTSAPIEAQGRLFIIRLEKKQPASCKEFEEVQNGIEQMMQFEFRRDQYERLVDKLMARADRLEGGQFAEACAQAGYGKWTGK